MTVREKVEAQKIQDPAELCKAYIWQHAYRLKLVDEYGDKKQEQMDETIRAWLYKPHKMWSIDDLSPIELSTLASILSGMR